MDTSGESVNSLEMTVQDYETQLAQVEEALRENENKESLLKLRNDLREVIALTLDLVSFKKQNENNAAIGDVLPNLGLSTLEEEAIGTAGYAEIEQQAPVPREESLLERSCLALYEGRTYTAEIFQVTPTPLGEMVKVRFYGYGSESEYLESQIRLLPVYVLGSTPPGTQLQALWTQDGYWYDISSLEPNEKDYKVTFTDYGQVEDVKPDQIRVKVTVDAKHTKKNAVTITPAGYRIPEHLVIKETDPEAVKISKKRRITALKRQQRFELAEKIATSRAAKWRKFNSRTTNQKKSGFLTGRGHTSIFKSADSIPTPWNVRQPMGTALSRQRRTDFEDAKNL